MIGTVYDTSGLFINEANFKVVKKSLPEDGNIPKHSHPDEKIVFTVVKGRLTVTLNDTEHHQLTPGKILTFDGVNTIQAVAHESSEVIVTLIQK